MKMIVGLGNPGREYQNTRHNTGFYFLDQFASKYDVKIDKNKFNANYQEIMISGEKVLLVKPLSYMNLSGGVVQQFFSYYHLSFDDLLIISDDLDLPIGVFRLKPSGSCGGHNGLRDIELHLATKDYKRLKIGISNEKMANTKDYVLGNFTTNELETLADISNEVCSILNDFITLSFSDLMNRYNHKRKVGENKP